MTERNPSGQRPLEETPEAAAAVDDETTVPQLVTNGEAGPDNPDFRPPGAAETGGEGDLIGDAFGGGSGGAGDLRTGAKQPWEPADLAVAKGLDPTPENVERARRELDQDGAAAVEKTVP